MSDSDDSNNGMYSGSESAQNNDWPQTVDEAVERILQGMSEADQQTVRSTPKDDLILFHRGWGMGIRNAFGLWQGNKALMKSCAEASGQAHVHPDDASMVIIEAAWQRLQSTGNE